MSVTLAVYAHEVARGHATGMDLPVWEWALVDERDLVLGVFSDAGTAAAAITSASTLTCRLSSGFGWCCSTVARTCRTSGRRR